MKNISIDNNDNNKGRIKKLLQVVKAIRTLECTPKFVAERNQAMHDYHDGARCIMMMCDWSYFLDEFDS